MPAAFHGGSELGRRSARARLVAVARELGGVFERGDEHRRLDRVGAQDAARVEPERGGVTELARQPGRHPSPLVARRLVGRDLHPLHELAGVRGDGHR